MLDDRDLVQALRRGGLVLLFRHAATDPAERDLQPVDFGNCRTQRNLSETGRAQARATGAGFQSLKIPVGAVWTSPYCRAVETARLAFGRAQPLADLALSERDDDPRHAALRRLVTQAGPAGMNTILVSHFPNIVLAAGLRPGEGEALIFSPGDDSAELLARVAPSAWLPLSERFFEGGCLHSRPASGDAS